MITPRRRVPGLAGVLIALLICCAAPLQALAQDTAAPTDDTATTVRAGVYLSPPFVMKGEDGYTGMAIELWDELAGRSKFETEFIEFETLRELIAGLRAGEIEVAVTNLTINEDRAQHIDFTHPWFDAGLQIMISEAPRTGFWNVVAGLSDLGHLRVFAWIGGIIILGTVLLTFFDRWFDPSFPKRWRDGLAESFYNVMSVATTGKPPARAKLFGWIGRIWSALWLVCGIAVLAYVTSSITTVMATLALTDRINGISDLPGKNIGVLEDGTGEAYARVAGLSAIAYPNIEIAVEAVVKGDVAAIVADAPVLDYFAHTRPEHDVTVVGEMFAPEKYGFGLPRNSPLRHPLMVDLLGADEDGRIEELRTQYFGARP